MQAVLVIEKWWRAVKDRKVFLSLKHAICASVRVKIGVKNSHLFTLSLLVPIILIGALLDPRNPKKSEPSGG